MFRRLMTGLIACGVVGGLSLPVQASDYQFFADKTSDGKQLGLDISVKPGEYLGWITFHYLVKSSDGTVIERSATTPDCKEALFHKAPYNLIDNYEKGGQASVRNHLGWLTIVDNKAVWIVADTKLSQLFLKNVCALSLMD